MPKKVKKSWKKAEPASSVCEFNHGAPHEPGHVLWFEDDGVERLLNFQCRHCQLFGTLPANVEDIKWQDPKKMRFSQM